MKNTVLFLSLIILFSVALGKKQKAATKAKAYNETRQLILSKEDTLFSVVENQEIDKIIQCKGNHKKNCKVIKMASNPRLGQVLALYPGSNLKLKVGLVDRKRIKGGVWYDFSWTEGSPAGHVSFRKSKNLIFGQLSHHETQYTIEPSKCAKGICNVIYEIDWNYFSKIIEHEPVIL